MTTRERFQALTTFQPFDRLPVVEWAGWWDQTITRWRGEGLPATVAGNRYAIYDHLGMDVWWQDWFRATHWDAPKPSHHGAGIIADEAGYERLRPHLFQILERWPFDAGNWQPVVARQQRGDAVLWFTVEGFFWYARTLLGIERHLYAFYDQPDLIHRINTDLSDWMLRMIDRVCAVCTPDFMTFAEDLSYNNGPMLSEEAFDTFLLPYYRRVVPALLARGILPVVDSDGDITRVAPWFERAGLRGILPLERQAGVDIARVRAAHPRMVFIGHYDKMVMNQGEAAMRREFERLLPTAATGGFVPSCDHQTPPGVSYADYQLYLALFREYAGEAGRRSRAGVDAPVA
jgi:hypothetical protein